MDKIKYPICFYQTFRGSISHLTSDNLKYFQLDFLNLPFSQIYLFKEACDKFNQDYTAKNYFNIDKNSQTLISPLEFGEYSLKGQTKQDSVKIYVNTNINDISNLQYLDFVEKMNADYIVCLSEQPQNESGKKSFKRNFMKIEQFLKETIQRFPNKNVMATIQLNTPQQYIKQFIENIKNENIYGLMLHDIQLDQQMIQQVLKVIKDDMPEELKNMNLGIYGDGNVIEILFGLYNGINIFNCVYPFNLANKGIALQFQNQLDQNELNKIKDFNINDIDFDKQAKNIDLNDIIYKKQFEPIQQNCRCYACTNHTKAYIYHLLLCKEMTGNVLLTIHNLHIYQNLIQDIKNCIDADIFQQYICWFIQTQTQNNL